MPKAPRQRTRRTAARTGPGAPTVQYKVVELSTVDEASLERAVNQGVSAGWTLDGVQFAMREASRRPAMAFVFFVREGAWVADGGRAEVESAGVDSPAPLPIADAWARLEALSQGKGR